KADESVSSGTLSRRRFHQRSFFQALFTTPSKEIGQSADLLNMSAAITKICDPAFYRLDEAIEKAKSSAEAFPGYEFSLVRFLQVQCLSPRVSLPTVFRGLEVLCGMLHGCA